MTRATSKIGGRSRRRVALLALAPLLALAVLTLSSEPALASPVATLAVSPGNQIVEGDTLEVTVTLATANSWEVWVFLHWTHDETTEADFGDDNDPFWGGCFFANCQQPSPYLLQFKPNQTTRTWTLPIVDDGVEEGPEQFRVSIHPNQLYFGGVRSIQTGTPNTQTVIIYDDAEDIPVVYDPVVDNGDGTFTVAADWSLTPAGLTSGDRFRLIFRTTSFTATTSSNIATYNAFVNGLALNAASADYCCSGAVQFKALASTPTVDARDNLGMWNSGTNTWRDASTNVPIYWIGTNHAVATSYAKLFGADGWTNGQHMRTQNGSAPSQYRDSQIGTGTAIGGQKASAVLLRPFGGAVGLEMVEAGLLQSSVDGVTAIAGSWRVEGKHLASYHITQIYGVSPVFIVR